MEQTTALLGTLKRYLKAKGYNYKRLAEEMNLSESSVKRLFSQQTFSLERLEEVCRVLNIDFFDLALMTRQDTGTGFKKMSFKQEQLLVEDPKLFSLMILLQSRWPISMITSEYDFTEPEISEMLDRLEKGGLIEVHPGNRIKLLVSGDAFSRKGGPLWRKYQKIVLDAFFDYLFNTPSDDVLFNQGQLSDTSIRLFRKKIDKLSKEFNELAEMDAGLPLSDRYGTGLIVGCRPWTFPTLESFLKKDPS